MLYPVNAEMLRHLPGMDVFEEAQDAFRVLRQSSGIADAYADVAPWPEFSRH